MRTFALLLRLPTVLCHAPLTLQPEGMHLVNGAVPMGSSEYEYEATETLSSWPPAMIVSVEKVLELSIPDV